MNDQEKKVVKEIDEDEINREVEDINEEIVDDTNTNKDFIKKILKFLVIFIIVMVVFMLILIIPSLLIPRTYKYSDIEDMLINATKKYYSDHSDLLPVDVGSTSQVDYATLVDEDYFKTLDEYEIDGKICNNAYITVEKTYTGYMYIPFLDCGADYSTTSFSNMVTNSNQVVTNGDGLYYELKSGNYIFRGENVNNYVKMGDYLWRIVKITSQGNLLLISADKIGYSTSWDDRFNSDKNYSSGYNDYSKSRIKEKVVDFYNNGIKSARNKMKPIITSKYKTYLVPFTLCVGRKDSNSEIKNNSDECKVRLDNQMIGLITVSDYVTASIDPGCKTITSKECQNYNYLAVGYEFWTLTGAASDSYSVYFSQRNGNIEAKSAASYANIRPTILLNGKVLYKSGKGTEKNPYKIR